MPDTWPKTIMMPGGEEVPTDGAICLDCNELMEDHDCPYVLGEQVTLPPNGEGNVVPFTRS